MGDEVYPIVPDSQHQLSTELNYADGAPLAEGSGRFGRRKGLNSLKSAVITKSEFNLADADLYHGIFTLSDAITPSSFIADQFSLPSSPPTTSTIPIPSRAKDYDEEQTNTLDNQRSYTYCNSYSAFNFLAGTPQPLQTNQNSPPSSPPIASTPLRYSQQIYPGLSTTPIRAHTQSIRNSSPFPFSTTSFNLEGQSPVYDELPRLSIPKLSTLMLQGSPSKRDRALSDPHRAGLTQSCPLPASIFDPSIHNAPSSPLAQLAFTPSSNPVPLPLPQSPPSSSTLQFPSSPQTTETHHNVAPMPLPKSPPSPAVSPKVPVSSLRRSGALNTSASTLNPTSVKFTLNPTTFELPEGHAEELGHLEELSVGSTEEKGDRGHTLEDEETEPAPADPEEERKKIIMEILSTEESYVQYLRLIKMIYIWPLRDQIQENNVILTELEISDLFANAENLLQVHITFLKQLRRRLRNFEPGVGIGDIFSEVGPYFKMYSTFVRSYFVKGIKLLRELNASNKKFKAFALDAKAKCKRLDLSDLLLMPVQRLPRYVLLLESLIKKTPEVHADYELLRNALTLVKKVADQVNLGTVDDSESLAVLLRIQDALGINAPKDLVQPHRKLVRQATLPLVVGDGQQTMQTNVYLFNDLLLLVEDRTSNLLECIEISRTFARKAAVISGYTWGFEIFTATWTRTFGLNSQEEEEQWVEVITKSTEVLTSLHPLHNAFRLQAMKDIHSTRKMSVGERASLFEHIATVHKNRNNTLPPLAHHNPVATIDAPLNAHIMVEKMRIQQEEMMRENHFLFEKVESHPRMRRTNTVTDFFKRLSQSQPISITRLPKPSQIVKSGYLTKQGGFVKSWKRRWFIMGNGHLYYTSDHMSNEVLGQIPLKGTVLEVDHDNTIRPFCMIMHTFHRSYYICADGEKGLDEWMVAISTYFMSLATLQKLTLVGGGSGGLPSLLK